MGMVQCCELFEVLTLFANAREKKKKKVPAVPETLKKKRRNFAELKIKRLRKKFAQKMVRKLF